MNLFTRTLLRFAVPILWVSAVLSGFGLYYSAKLYMNLRTDLEELLPSTARSVVDLNEVTTRLESIDNLSVLVMSDQPQASKRFVIDLAKRLEAVPKDIVASVEYNISKELQWFNARRPLYMDVKDLEKVRDYVRDRIAYERILYNPLTIFSEIEVKEPKFDVQSLRMKYESKVSSYAKFPDGYYATPDEKKRVVLVYMPGKTSGVGNVQKIKKAVVQAVAELDPASYDPNMQILYTGGVQNTIEEQEALVEDLELSTVVVMIIVTLAMLVFYRAKRVTFALMTALLAGTFWTFGASYFLVGYLNANSAFLGAIVLGNGINFPIILLARYMEERRTGRHHRKALDQAIRHTASATWTAALAAGLSYGSLALTSFRGFRQFGIIGLAGMILCWIAAFTVLPALLTVLNSRKTLKPRGSPPKSYFAASIAHFVQHYPKPITVVSAIITVASLAALTRYSPKILETDLTKLRNKESMERGSGYLSKHVDEIFGRYLSPMVALPHSREDALKIAEKLRQKQKNDGEYSLIASVQTIDDFVPSEQERKIRLIREIESMLPPSILQALPPRERALANEYITPESKTPITMKDLPELVITKFTERDKSLGKLVLIEPPLNGATLDGDNLVKFIHEIREAADSVSPGTPIAGALPISADMIESISRDGPKATLFAFLAVVLLVIVLFRRVSVFSPVVLALSVGILWMGGVILGFWFKINFLNFIALPITFGIGVDYAVNIFSRYREEGAESIVKVLRDTGGAVALCSFTTVVGYGSLLIASNQAFVSFGLLSIIGEATCLVAALFSMPALLLLWNAKKSAPSKRGVA